MNFARTGDPNGPGLPAWPPLTEGRRATELGDEPRAIGWPDRDEHRLMDEYMNSLRRAPALMAGTPARCG